MIKISFTLLFFLFQSMLLFSQPGSYGSNLILKLREPDNNYKVYQVYQGKYTEIKVNKNDEYIVSAGRSPAGGYVLGYVEIISQKIDTMRIFHPKLNTDKPTVINNIPFRKGNYRISKLVYTVNNWFKPEYRIYLKPSLDGDWSAFEIKEKQTLKKVYLRRVELFKNPKLFSSLFPISSNPNIVSASCPYFLKDYFITLEFYKNIEGCGSYCYPASNYYDYYFFGVIVNSNIFLYKKKSDSAIEYGTITVPIYRNMQQEKGGCYKGLRYPNLENEIEFISKNISFIHFKPYALGYYVGKKECNESFGTVKEMWGIFQIYINKPDEKIMEIITKEHTLDNNLK